MKTCNSCQDQRRALAAETREIVISHASRPGIHLGGTLSAIELLVALADFNCEHCGTLDTFPSSGVELSLSKGHASLAVAAISDITKRTDYASGFGENGGIGVQVAPTWSNLSPSGSLGNHLGIALGRAYADKVWSDQVKRQIVIAGDSEIESGAFLESLVRAESLQLGSVTLVVDANGFGVLESVDRHLLRSRFAGIVRESWHVDFVDGHDLDALRSSLADSARYERGIVVAETIKGKGFEPLEGQARSHHGTYINNADR